MIVPMQQFFSELWTAILATIFPVATPPSVHLYTNNVFPQPNMTAASFTEATFTGYAAVPVTAFLTPDFPGNTSLVAYNSTVLVFTATGSTAGQVVFGYYITDHAGNLVAAEQLPASVDMSHSGAILKLLVPFGTGPWSASVVQVP